MSLAMFTSIGVAASAQQATIQGLVIGRDRTTLSVKTTGAQRLTVILSDSTKTTEKGGFLGLDRKDPGMAQLVPGLQVRVEGDYDPNHQLLAKKIVFSRSSLTTAQQIDAGLNPVAGQVAAAQDQLKSDRRDIEQGQQDISKNSQEIDTTKQGLDATTQATSTNTQDIGKANQRFTSLDQYEPKNSVTIAFANGKAIISDKDKEQLTDFAKSAADTPGYMIEVQGYASAVGSATLNQRLSSERADAVLAIIQQSGVPLTRILAPAAMGTTDQVADNHTRSGQAQNRRVVVTILVNKGITGDTSSSGL
jgi:OmpA-OmpF porin, OOP family